MTYYYHDVPGRLRVKSPKLKGDHTQCRSVQDFVASHDGVHAVAANPVTGSVVVNYDPKCTTSKGIMEILSQGGYFHPEKAVTTDRYINSSAQKVGHLVGKAVLGACVEKMFEGSALSLITVLL
jgi:heavy-metal-associated domain-containing protein